MSPEPIRTALRQNTPVRARTRLRGMEKNFPWTVVHAVHGRFAEAGRGSLPRMNGLVLAAAGAVLALMPAALPAQTARSFDPVEFFTGKTTGEGWLKKVFSSAQATHVTGYGAVDRGVLVLDQTVTIAGEPRRERQWRLRAVSPGRWTGTLSDARGVVNASAAGAVLTIAYTSNDGMGIVQTVTLAADGRSARNLMKIRKFGVAVATLDETITRD